MITPPKVGDIGIAIWFGNPFPATVVKVYSTAPSEVVARFPYAGSTVEELLTVCSPGRRHKHASFVVAAAGSLQEQQNQAGA